LAGGIVRVTTAAGLVVAVRLVLGAWPAAFVLAAVGVGWLLVLWAGVEARAFGGDRPAGGAHSDDAPAAGHVAFARALAAVAASYLAACEREARR
jgi:hypothetical protein